MTKDAKAAAREIRKVLKSTYPGHRFSVRISRFSGGSSVEITWTDGPTGKEVRELTKLFKGHENGYYNDWVMDNRSVSLETMLMAARAAAEYYEVNVPIIHTSTGHPYITDLTIVGTGNHIEALADKVHRAAHSTSLWRVELESAFDESYPNPVAKRLG